MAAPDDKPITPERSPTLPHFVRLRNAPAYLGMDRNRFNAEVRPYLTRIPIGRQVLPSIDFNWTPGPINAVSVRRRSTNSGWQGARKGAGLSQVRVHDLKPTFGRRLRAAGVSFEDRQDLLGHRSGRITSHYSVAELTNLIQAANQVLGQGSRKSPALVMLKKKAVNAGALTA